jgi:hypothetical protein
MDALVKELNERYGRVQNKTGTDFIIAVCDYLTLLEYPEIQELLLRQKDNPDIRELNIWQPYRKMYTEVFELYNKEPENFKQNFSQFYFLSDWLDFPYVLYFHRKGIKAMWQKFVYRNRIEDIHKRLPVLLKNIELFKNTKPVVKRFEFNTDKSILYLNQYEIPINRHGSITDQHRILAFMFKHEDLSQEFFYAEMADDVFGDEYDRNPRPYWTACEEINRKVSEATKGLYPKFLLSTLEKKGLVKINPECLALFR